MDTCKVIEVTPENVKEETLFCIKDITNLTFENKRTWFVKRYKEGLRIKILKNTADKMLGFIEYVPAEFACRPVDADSFMFIHCRYVFAKNDRDKGYGSKRIWDAEKGAKSKNMAGICVITSKGAWMANKSIFEKNSFKEVDYKGRFEWLAKKLDSQTTYPKLRDLIAEQNKYQGWHLVYANQCPRYEKSVETLLNVDMDNNIDLKDKKISIAKEAKNAPSGYGVFSLLHNEKLLEDHYISAIRFRNMLKKEHRTKETVDG